MSGLFQGVGHGVAHSSFILLLAWILCWGWQAFGHGHASRLMRATTLLAFTLSLAAFLPIPSYSTSLVFEASNWFQNRRTSDKGLAPKPVDRVHSDSGLAIWTPQFRFSSLTTPPKPRSGRAVWPLLVSAVSVCLVTRQIGGLCSIRSLVGKSESIELGPCADEFESLRKRLNSRQVELRSTSQLPTAATVGCLRPVILLPRDYTTWSQEERRSALAHELAHVQQRDFIWRLLANLFAAAHFFNPLAHWLLRRLTLEQELMADRIASEVLGSRRDYARGLSLLAMRVDKASSPTMYTGLLSVTSTNLLRRVEMLRAKDGSASSRYEKGVVSWGVPLLVLATVAATGMRASAQKTPLEQQLDSSVSQAKERAHSDSRSLGPRKPSPTFDLRELSHLEQGAFVIRPSLLVSDEMGVLGQVIRQRWLVVAKEVGFPALDLSKIEAVAGGLQVSIKHVGDTTEPNDEGKPEHQLIFGAKLALVRLHEPQDLKARLTELFPDAEVVENEDGLLRLPMMPALGPHPIYVRVVDDRTIAIGHEDLGPRDEATHSESPSWEPQWRAVDGGALTVLVDQTKIDWPGTRKHWPASVDKMVAQTELFGLSLQPAKVPNLVYEATQKDDSGVALTQAWIKATKATLAEILKKEDRADGRFLAEWLATATITQPKRHLPTIRFSGPIQLPFAESGHPDDKLKARRTARATSGESIRR